MHCSTLMKKYAEERFQLCVWMARIAKKRDIENKIIPMSPGVRN